MNTSCLLQSKLTLQETRSIHDSMNIQKIEFIAYIYILLYIYYIKIIFNLEIKTVLYLKYNRINGLVGVLMEKRNSKFKHREPLEQTRDLFC